MRGSPLVCEFSKLLIVGRCSFVKQRIKVHLCLNGVVRVVQSSSATIGNLFLACRVAYNSVACCLSSDGKIRLYYEWIFLQQAPLINDSTYGLGTLQLTKGRGGSHRSVPGVACVFWILCCVSTEFDLGFSIAEQSRVVRLSRRILREQREDPCHHGQDTKEYVKDGQDKVLRCGQSLEGVGFHSVQLGRFLLLLLFAQQILSDAGVDALRTSPVVVNGGAQGGWRQNGRWSVRAPVRGQRWLT